MWRFTPAIALPCWMYDASHEMPQCLRANGLALCSYFPNLCCWALRKRFNWGDAVDGLRLSLDVDDNAHELLFSIQNVSEHTELVDIGDNGIPVRITVGLTTKDGKVRDGELGMSSAMHASGAGIYENIVEILPKSTYVIRHSMGDFTPIATVEPRVFPLMTVKSGDMITGH